MKQRILIIASEFPPGPGGIGQHAYCLAKALNESGFEIVVISSADYAHPSEIVIFDQTQPFKVNRQWRSGRLSTYMKRLQITLVNIRKSNYLVVILTGKFSIWQGLMLKVLYPNLRTLAILHGSEINIKSNFFRWLTHRAIAKADLIIPVSHFTRSLLPEWILKKHKHIHVIPNGINEYPFSTEKKSYAFGIFGFPSLLTVGHVSPRKGQHRVIQALPHIIKTWPKVHYHIVGRPINQNYLETLAKEKGVQNHITFHGRVLVHRDLEMYYKQADVFMLLSENQPDGDVEGFGIVALEANTFGIPVVGAKYCGVEEAVNHLNSGYLVDGDNPAEILDGINYCISHKESLQKGAVAWTKAHQWTVIVQRYIELVI